MGPDPGRAAEDRALLVAAAEAGGRVALAHHGRSPRAWEKAGGQGPVSDADLAVNEALAAKLRAARPDYAWLSEEDPDTPARLGAARVFVLDPIDGTRAFLAGKPDFAVSIAVGEHARVTAGVVHLPARETTYAAHLGGGAARDGRPIAPSGRTELAGAAAVGPKSQYRAEHWPGGAPRVEASFRAALAWRLCLVAEGRFDLKVTVRPAWEWDVAAGALICTEAGARVADAEGRPLSFNAPEARLPGVIAAAPGIFNQIVALRCGA